MNLNKRFFHGCSKKLDEGEKLNTTNNTTIVLEYVQKLPKFVICLEFY